MKKYIKYEDNNLEMDMAVSYLNNAIRILKKYPSIDSSSKEIMSNIRDDIPELLNLSNEEIYNVYQLGFDYRRLKAIKNLISEISLQNKVLVIHERNCRNEIIRNIIEFVKTGSSCKQFVNQSFLERNFEEKEDSDFEKMFKLLEIFSANE